LACITDAPTALIPKPSAQLVFEASDGNPAAANPWAALLAAANLFASIKSACVLSS
jgi:hypothetical protein